MEINRKIYAFWLNGDESTLTPNRKAGLETMRINFGVPVELVTANTLSRYILPAAPLHEGFKYLSKIHQSDYLRCYFMHFYGGGYSDIKFYGQNTNWNKCFDMFGANSDLYVVGKKEIKGGSPYKEWKYDEKEIEKLLANGWFICRPQTAFTTQWYESMLQQMDRYFSALKAHPADPSVLRGGGRGYPVPWAAIQGQVFHKVLHELNAKHKANCLTVDWLNKPYI